MIHSHQKIIERCIYSVWDLQQALSATTFLLDECDYNNKHDKITLRRFRCYETQAIISFCRPFTDHSSSSVLGLKRIGLKLTKAERDLKNEILKLRNKVIAHSDSNEMHYKSFHLTIQKYNSTDTFCAPYFLFDETLLLSYRKLLELETLTKKILEKLINHAFELCKEHPEFFENYKTPDRLS